MCNRQILHDTATVIAGLAVAGTLGPLAGLGPDARRLEAGSGRGSGHEGERADDSGDR